MSIKYFHLLRSSSKKQEPSPHRQKRLHLQKGLHPAPLNTP
ncbi:hypothetical protein DESPIG_00812 [Desulfovibrio piger ATCC 29098]|uniref:Uncharacterized protein n=1 Tax=Desulfovibrio piger ATCC 29098 TaxID=411464 RepID=B6WRW9_9BACT|nr:hypothetical protein DESPIG_00812 [Desulfovibrio piger ATCC 29098]